MITVQKVLYTICATILLAAISVSPNWAKSDIEINHLLNYVKSSGCIFIRNGKEYPAEEAYHHLKKKYEYAIDSIQTAEKFIDHIATKSSITGRPYRVRCNGQEMHSPDWLRIELRNLRSDARHATE